MDIAALLIKYNTCVNVVDKWGFTPLHEAAQKGRTQLCALLVSQVNELPHWSDHNLLCHVSFKHMYLFHNEALNMYDHSRFTDYCC